MALINCPECGKEISDRVKACPFCGYPFEENTQTTEKQPKIQEKKSHKKRFILIPVFILILIVVVGGVLYYINIVKPQNTYNEAVKLLNEGEYAKANSKFDKIISYKDVSKLKKEIKYESLVYQCASSVRQNLKNPDSLQIYEVTFYKGIKKDISSDMKDKLDTFDKLAKKYPFCVMDYGGQNGFGGNTESYGVFTYDNDSKKYAYFGSCDSLNVDDLDSDSDDYDEQKTICNLISIYQDDFNRVGQVDLKRIKNIIKNESYSAIKIIK